MRTWFQSWFDGPLCRRILRLSGPLILSSTSVLIMQVVDGLMVSWYSPDAIAAISPAGGSAWIITCIFMGATGYTTTLVAQYSGAGRPARVGPAVWQGIHFAVGSGIVVALFAVPMGRLFDLVGHTPRVTAFEKEYFTILCQGMVFTLTSNALSGFFIGRGETRILMAAQIAAAVLNGVLDYVLIFGKAGFPEMGIAGAAIATVASQVLLTVLLGMSFLRRTCREECATWTGRRWDGPVMKILVRFGFPSGFRFAFEILAWMVFVVFIGRIGTTELASSSIAWRINGVAFFPIFGISEAIRMLVGQAQGRRDPDESVRVTHNGMFIAEVWMITAAVLFVLVPGPLYEVFRSPDRESTLIFDRIAAMGVVLLRFVAVYCTMDAFNIVYVTALQAAGDTRWSMVASVLAHVVFVGALFAADYLKAGVYIEWLIATVFVVVLGYVWVVRFRSGKWRDIRVIESTGVDVP